MGIPFTRFESGLYSSSQALLFDAQRFESAFSSPPDSEPPRTPLDRRTHRVAATQLPRWPNDTFPSIAGRSSRQRTHSSPRSSAVAVRNSRSRSERRSVRKTWPSVEALALAQTVLVLRWVLPLTVTMTLLLPSRS